MRQPQREAPQQQARPLRFIVDTSQGNPEALRLLELAVLLEEGTGLRVQAAAVATAQELAAVLDELPDETSRLLLRSRVFTYTHEDSFSYQKAMEKARREVPNLDPEAVITEMDPSTVGWFLETIGLLTRWEISPALRAQVNSLLTFA